MTAYWDPERLLGIRGRPLFASGIQCHGETRGAGSRCGWTKGGRDAEKPDVKNAETFLHSMAMKSPSEVTAEDRQYLAKLCLCRDHHQDQDQIDRLANKWAMVIEDKDRADRRRDGKMSGSWFRRLQGWLKRLRPRF